MLWANPSKAHVLLITAARASQLYWLLFVISFVKFVCVFVLGLQLSNMMQPLCLANIFRNLFCFICLTYMSMCPLLQDGCSSFDIALEVGKKIESLQVETCEASSEDDKKFDCTQIRTFHSSRNEKLPLTPC